MKCTCMLTLVANKQLALISARLTHRKCVRTDDAMKDSEETRSLHCESN